MDEIIEETKENPVEETTENETPNEEKDTPNEKTESPEQYTEREKRYYARMKQAENIAKTAREELAKARKPVGEIDAILEVQEATKDLTVPEITELRLRANALGKSLSDTRKDENFKLWQKAYKEKVEKENPPLPSTTQGNAQKGKSLKEMSMDERTDLFRKLGLTSNRANPRPPAR